MVEKKVVEEEEKIKDTREIATADRARKVAIIEAEEKGEAAIIEHSKLAEAEKLAAEIKARTLLIDAEANMNAAEKEAEARKIKAEAKAAEEATIGLSEAQVIEAKAKAKEYEGSLEAVVIEKKAVAEAKGVEAKAEANRKEGLAQAEVLKEKGLTEAKVLGEKLSAEAKGVEEKAVAMKKLDGVGKEHEEFKLNLEKEKEVELANINIQKAIADAQAKVLAEAFKYANIDIVGGEATFVDNIMNAVNRGKVIDRTLDNSKHLRDAKTALIGDGNGGGLLSKISNLISKSGTSADDLKNLTVAGLLAKMGNKLGGEEKEYLTALMEEVKDLGLGGQQVKSLL